MSLSLKIICLKIALDEAQSSRNRWRRWAKIQSVGFGLLWFGAILALAFK